jgi:hypothetical protein
MKHTPQEGDHLEPDGWPANAGEKLRPDNTTPDSEFPGCQWRVRGAAWTAKPIDIAVNVTVTGKPHFVRGPGLAWRSRVQIEYVGDGEPSTFDGGWLYHK